MNETPPRQLRLSDRLSRAIAGLGGVSLVVVLGTLGETGADHGAIKDIWEGLKVPSPVISMVLAFGLYIVWREWQRDRGQHTERTSEYINGMNTAARLREIDMREKSKLRQAVADANAKLAALSPRRRGRA